MMQTILMKHIIVKASGIYEEDTVNNYATC